MLDVGHLCNNTKEITECCFAGIKSNTHENGTDEEDGKKLYVVDKHRQRNRTIG